ncbi:hypothetical protein HanPI659440_Chr15g0613291 [Helianthus annuus]|nr:hypothetical protein HanPI659440_Chr15g0613291 [Helianthus annuus]
MYFRELVDLAGYACVKLRLNKRCYPGLLSLEGVFLSWTGYIILNSGFIYVHLLSSCELS